MDGRVSQVGIDNFTVNLTSIFDIEDPDEDILRSKATTFQEALCQTLWDEDFENLRGSRGLLEKQKPLLKEARKFDVFVDDLDLDFGVFKLTTIAFKQKNASRPDTYNADKVGKHFFMYLLPSDPKDTFVVEQDKQLDDLLSHSWNKLLYTSSWDLGDVLKDVDSDKYSKNGNYALSFSMAFIDIPQENVNFYNLSSQDKLSGFPVTLEVVLTLQQQP